MKDYRRAEGLGNPDPSHIKPKAQAEDEQGRSKLLGDIAEDNPVLGKPRSWKEKVAHPQRQPSQVSQTKGLAQWASYGGMVEEQF